MRPDFSNLLDATIVQLERMKREGVQYVPVSTVTLEALRRPARTSAASKPQRASETSPGFAGKVPAPAQNLNSPATSPGATVAVQFAGGAERTPLAREAKAAAMEELRGRALVCQKCGHLAAARKHVVFGVGDIHSPLMFVGEAPGADEDTQGEPFVGRAGQLLTRIIQTMGFSRDTVFIANILKCRPDTPGQTAGNRKPTGEEMKTCLPYLLAQIEIIQPRVIVALGATAVEGLMGRVQGITRLRGQWLTFQDIPLMPTYHPAYLLRNQSLAAKREVWEDMLRVLERLDRPISEKQRNYFLKASAE